MGPVTGNNPAERQREDQNIIKIVWNTCHCATTLLELEAFVTADIFDLS